MVKQSEDEPDEKEMALYKMSYGVFSKWTNIDYNPDNLAYTDYQKMMVDATVSSAIKLKKALVLMKPISFTYKGKNKERGDEIVKFLKWSEGQVQDGFKSSVKDILNAYWVGFTITEKVWKLIEEGEYKNKWIIGKLKVLKPDSLTSCFNTDDFNNLKSVIQNAGKEIMFSGDDLNRLAIYTNEIEFGNRYGLSDLKGAYNPWYQKFYSHRAWGVHIQRKGSLPLIGKYASGNDEPRLRQMLKQVDAESILTIPKESEVELLKGDTVPSQTFEMNLKYNDGQVNLAILLPSLVMGVEDSGTRALGDTHLRMFEYHIEDRKDTLAIWLWNNYYKPQVEINFGKVEDEEFECKFEMLSDKDKFKMSQTFLNAVNAGYLDPSYRDDADYMRAEIGAPFASPDASFQKQAPPSPFGGGAPEPKMPDVPNRVPKEQGTEPRNVAAKREYSRWDKVESTASQERALISLETQFTAVLDDVLVKCEEDYIGKVKHAKKDISAFAPLSGEIHRAFVKFSNYLIDKTKIDLETKLKKVSHSLKAREASIYAARKYTPHEMYEETLNNRNYINANKMADNLAYEVRQRILDEMQKNPEIDQDVIIAAIQDEFNTYTAGQLKTVVRTTVHDYYETVRDTICKESGIVVGYQERAVLDRHTTEFCDMIDGKTIAIDDPLVDTFRPPSMFNCRRSRMPLFAEDDITFDTDWADYLDALDELQDGRWIG